MKLQKTCTNTRNYSEMYVYRNSLFPQEAFHSWLSEEAFWVFKDTSDSLEMPSSLRQSCHKKWIWESIPKDRMSLKVCITVNQVAMQRYLHYSNMRIRWDCATQECITYLSQWHLKVDHLIVNFEHNEVWVLVVEGCCFLSHASCYNHLVSLRQWPEWHHLKTTKKNGYWFQK